MEAILVVLSVAGQLTFNNGDFGPHSCALVAQELRQSASVSQAYCVVMDGDEPRIIKTKTEADALEKED